MQIKSQFLARSPRPRPSPRFPSYSSSTILASGHLLAAIQRDEEQDARVEVLSTTSFFSLIFVSGHLLTCIIEVSVE